jgi:homoserine acetyltransferase
LLERGAEVSFAEIESPYGRDAFLLECERQGALVGGFLDRARAECRDREMSIR